MMMAGALHPPFSLFLPEEKEKTGRARSKREKEVMGDAYGWTGGAQAVLPVSRMPSARGSVLAGVWISTNGPAALSAAADAVETERESGRRSSNGNAGVRQQKEKLVHSARNKTPACTTPRSEDFRTKPPEPLPRPRKPRPLVFLFWTVHGPFSLFIRGIKRENGGCNGPAIIMAAILPARQGEYQPGLTARYAP